MASIATAEFKAWMDKMLQVAMPTAAELIDDGHEVSPHIMVFDHEWNMAYVAVRMNDINDKNVTAALHRHLSTRPGLVAGAVLVSETWQLSVPKTTSEEDKAALSRMRRSEEGISEHPDRTEAMMWSALRGDMQLLAFAPIKTNKKTGKRYLGKPTILDVADHAVDGRMVADPGASEDRHTKH